VPQHGNHAQFIPLSLTFYRLAVWWPAGDCRFDSQPLIEQSATIHAVMAAAH
jgi:hypothetical protein